MGSTFGLVHPQVFSLNPLCKTLEFDSVTYVEYHAKANFENCFLVFSTNILILVLKGEKKIYHGDQQISIKAGEAFFAVKGAYVGSQLICEGDEYKSLVFFIHDDFLLQFFQKYQDKFQLNREKQEHQLFIFPIQQNPLFINSVVSFIPYFMHPDKITHEIFHLKLYEILLNLGDYPEGKKLFSYLYQIYHNQKTDLVECMELNYTQPYTLDEFASISGRSLTTFKNDFKAFFHLSPKKWINQKRLQLAYTMLLHSDKNVTEICYGVGFESISHFIQLFKQTYDITPKKLQLARNQQKKALLK
ncbi:MAG: AraC family transcriptional regulator [Spirochaetes bacterium]|nr:AraC family transcriptional regulator [Spirochaetota bacterium]